MSKSLRVSALLLVCLSLVALPAFAGQGQPKAPSFSVSAGAPTIQSITQEDLQGRVLDISRMPVLLDGVPLPEGPQAKQALRELYLVIDDEQGVIHAFRTAKEFEAQVKASGKLDCSALKAAAAVPMQCIYFNGPNCTFPPATRAVAVNCGFLVPNITGPALLNGPIQSFIAGCTGAVLIPNANCTTPPNGVAVTAPLGVCINITVPNPFNCAGCLPAPPPPPAQ